MICCFLPLSLSLRSFSRTGVAHTTSGGLLERRFRRSIANEKSESFTNHDPAAEPPTRGRVGYPGAKIISSLCLCVFVFNFFSHVSPPHPSSLKPKKPPLYIVNCVRFCKAKVDKLPLLALFCPFSKLRINQINNLAIKKKSNCQFRFDKLIEWSRMKYPGVSECFVWIVNDKNYSTFNTPKGLINKGQGWPSIGLSWQTWLARHRFSLKGIFKSCRRRQPCDIFQQELK